MLYKSVFNKALNSKRSSCKQAARKIVLPALMTMETDEFFRIEELCKLRRSTTEREMDAFYWFFGLYLECVCGKKANQFFRIEELCKLRRSTTEREMDAF
jgi:hypothetical protein